MLKIAIITNIRKDIGLATAMKVASFLCNKAEVYMNQSTLLPQDFGVKYLPDDELWKVAELAVVIGGDGTLLSVAPDCAKQSIPAIGINLGKVGFLTEIETQDLENALLSILEGRYTTEKRMLLKLSINNENASYHALNDIVVARAEGVKLVDVDLYTGNEHVYHYCADGLIIATPTGSTAYSISAGGPVVDPRMKQYVATPICAHMLSARSAVLPSDDELIIKIAADNAVISTDGEKQRFISPDDVVRISKSDYEFELIKIGNASFYKTLASKLS